MILWAPHPPKFFLKVLQSVFHRWVVFWVKFSSGNLTFLNRKKKVMGGFGSFQNGVEISPSCEVERFREISPTWQPPRFQLGSSHWVSTPPGIRYASLGSLCTSKGSSWDSTAVEYAWQLSHSAARWWRSRVVQTWHGGSRRFFFFRCLEKQKMEWVGPPRELRP